ncbi:MAG: hypothetical protein WCF24_07990 [Acidimicrobiales bacterium]
MAHRSPLSEIWPLYDLAIRSPRLEPRYPNDADPPLFDVTAASSDVRRDRAVVAALEHEETYA